MRSVAPHCELRSTLMIPWKSESQMLDALDRAKAALRLEGIELTAEEAELLERDGRGELSEEQFREMAMTLAERSRSTKA